MAITFAATPILKVDETSGLDAGTQDVTATRATLPTTLVGRIDTLLSSTTWDTTIIQFSERANAITGLGPNATDVAFTKSDGTLLVGVDSGLTAIDGKTIFLYTDTNNNLVLGREGVLQNGVYVADPSGAIALVIYMETNGTGAQGDTNATAADLWVIELTPIQHPNASDPNDFVSLTNKLFVQVTNPISFNADKSPSGNNLFITYADGTPGANNNNTPASGEFGVVVTAVGAANTSAGESLSSGPTVKTSQAGSEFGGATFGVDSQMVDPPQNAADSAEALYFTFVKGITPNYTVPNLSPTEADVEANIQFQSLVGATKVSFQVVQLQPASTKATLHIDALVASTAAAGATNAIGDDTPFTGNAYIDNQETNTSVNITKVTINRGGTLYVFTEGGTTSDATADLTLSFAGNGVDIQGLLSGDRIIYETPSEHDRLQITNIGNLSNATYNSSFDIGSLVIESGGVTRSALPDIQLFDDGPNANGTPVTATVDEDGTPLLAGANTNAALGDSNAGSTATGSIAGIFNAGRDGLQTFQLNSVTTGLPQNLTSQGGAVLYNVNGTTLTAYVEVSNANGNGDNATEDHEVFTLALSGTNNSTYLFTLIDQLDHPLTNDPSTVGVTEILFEDDLTLNLGTSLQIKDGDNDVATGDATDFVITLDDDSPVINGSTNLVYSNSLNGAGNPGGTGKFDYSVGVDDRDAPAYSLSNTDLIVTLSGFVGNSNNPLTAIDVDWLSETDSQATFEFDFTYISNPTTGATATLLNNTIVFDKVNDTYTVHLVNPISSFSVLTLSDPGVGFSGYQFDSTTPMGGIAGVTTAKLANNFFVQFKGFAEPSGNGTDSPDTLAGNGNLDALALGEAWSHNDDDIFTTASGASSELFTLALPSGQTNPAGVSISGDSAGTNSDTMQSGEVLDFTLYAGDPQGLLNPQNAAKTSAATIFIEFDQLGFNVGKQTGEDLVVVLKLVDANNPNLTTTRAVIVQATDIYHNGDALPAGFGFTSAITGNNGLVIIEHQDYNFGSENWVIQGAQVLASTEGVTSASAVDLNRAVGAGGASVQAGPGFSDSADSGNGTTSTWDSDVFKIVNIGFVSNVSPDASLSFGVQVVDRDGDTTASQTLAVTMEADNTFAGTNSADTFVMRDIPADLDLTLSQETRTINGFDPAADFLDFATAGSATNFLDGGTNNTSLASLIANADAALDDPAVIYYFARFGGDGYLAYDADTSGLTALVKLTGVTSGFTFGDII